jgi:glycosyltransferase involved in cell wall biosynthesis
MKNPRLTIIIPIYNVAEYLPQCLDSVFIQDLTDCEVICVNDGSTDNSGGILRDYKEKYPKLIIIDRQNGGLSAARNTGLEVAKGEYIYFLDSDDYLYEGVLSKMLDFVLQNKLEVGCFNVLKDGETPYFDSNYKFEKATSGTVFCKMFFASIGTYYPAPVWMYIYNLHFLRKNDLYFEEGRLHEDEEFTPRVLFFTEKVGLLNIPIQFHRLAREGAITSTVSEKHISDSIKNCRDLFLFFKSKSDVDFIYFHSVYFYYLLVLLKAYENHLSGHINGFFTKADLKNMQFCAANDYDRRCVKLSGISFRLLYLFYKNKLPRFIMKIINRLL